MMARPLKNSILTYFQYALTILNAKENTITFCLLLHSEFKSTLGKKLIVYGKKLYPSYAINRKEYLYLCHVFVKIHSSYYVTYTPTIALCNNIV